MACGSRKIADRVLVMQSGRIVEQGSAADVLQCPQHSYTQPLLDALPRGDFRAGAIDAAASPALEGRQLCMRFETPSIFKSKRRRVDALSELSLQLARGEILGIVGESGSGKTTLGRCLARFAVPTSGDILIDGEPLSELTAADARGYCKRVQRVFQHPFRSFNPRRKLGPTLAKGAMNFGGDAQSVNARIVGDAGTRRHGCELARPLFARVFGCQRQRLSIPRALMMEPQIRIADEVVSALLVSVQAQILDLLDSIRERLGARMVFITHDLRVAARLCHRIAVMQRGQLVEIGTAQEIFLRPCLCTRVGGGHTRACAKRWRGEHAGLRDLKRIDDSAQPEPRCHIYPRSRTTRTSRQ